METVGKGLLLQSNIVEDLAQSNLLGSSEELNNRLNSILINQEVIIENQNSILKLLGTTATKDNQLLIIQQLAKYEATLNVMANKINKTPCTNDTYENEKKATNISIDKIKTADELDKLETLLQDNATVQDYVDRLSIVCGQKGNGNGLNHCYLLVDRLFSRQFLTLCSWAGGSRDKKEKIPFKIYKNVINLFFKIIHLSDTTFTIKDCEEFFKSIIRNATRRSQSNMVRTSSIKRRPRKLVYTKEKQLEVKVHGKKMEKEKEGENLKELPEVKGKECSYEEEEQADDDGNVADIEEIIFN